MANNAKKVRDIPSWLEYPADGIIEPPVSTRIQLLPFEKLTWENFERLCLRLVRLEENVEFCNLYGERGEDQSGIDIYARKKSQDKYKVYQCKNESSFGAQKIKDAVSEFISDEWANQSEEFILCTREELNNTSRVKAIEEQSKVLKEKGITFIPWDKSALSTRLKAYPEIVDDFFGRAWVKAFCGEEAAIKLGKRLDVEAVHKLRKGYQKLYTNVFNVHDPGLSITASANGDNFIELSKRYVIPDILSEREATIKTKNNNTDQEISEIQERVSTNQLKFEQRESIDRWLSFNPRNVILGDPGIGKSALLRFIAIDLLSDAPKMSALAKRWGTFTPVWIPFGLWTKQIADGNRNFVEILLTWLRNWGYTELIPLVEQAIEEKKILLLIDGLDEWTNESAAGIALDQLEVFTSQYDVPVIMTSRPYGFTRLQLQRNAWEIGELADFTSEQQQLLARIWFLNRYKALNKDGNQTDKEIQIHVDNESEQFINEISINPDLSDIAKNPLLLSILIFLRFQNARLPQSRFKAYEEIIDHLIADHPKLRKRSSLLTDELSEFSNDDVKKILSYFAYELQTKFAEGLISVADATQLITDYLSNDNYGFGLPNGEAKKLASIILSFGESSSGILVMRSPSTISFYHRTLQEFLSAFYITSMSLDEQKQLVSDNCIDPQWREALLSLFYLTNRQSDLEQFIDKIKTRHCNLYESYHKNLLIYEAALSDFSLSPSQAKDYILEAINSISLNPWMPERKSLLNIMMNGLRSVKVKEVIKENLSYWIPNRTSWRRYIYQGMTNWSEDDEVINVLKRAMRDESLDNQITAAVTLATICKKNKDIKNWFRHTAKRDINVNTQAVALNALLGVWPEKDILDEAIKNFRNSLSPAIKALAIRAKVISNLHDDKDLDDFIELGSFEKGAGYYWDFIIEDTLVRGWKNSEKLKKACLESRQSRDEITLDSRISRSVMLRAFPNDPEIADFIANNIKREPFPLNGFGGVLHEPWEYIVQNFNNHPLITQALDEWIPKQEHRLPEISRAALVGKTEVAKNKLLNSLDNHFSFWIAEALLEGWGMKDKEVADALNKVINDSAAVASRFGMQIPGIMNNPSKSRKKLLSLLKDPSSERPDFVFRGLIELGVKDNDKETVKIVMDRIKIEKDHNNRDSLIRHLIAHYSSSAKVRDLAMQEMTRHDGAFSEIAGSYGNDKELRKLILQLAAPIDKNLREIIASRLHEFTADEKVLTLLKNYDLESDSSIKSTLSIAYHSYLIKSASDLTDAAGTLSKNILAYGSDYEIRREAAFCGLVCLKKVDLMQNIYEKYGSEGQPVSISVSNGMHLNPPFIKLILKNWDYLKSSFGNEFDHRLSKRSDINHFWDTLAISADEFEKPKQELIELIQANRLVITPNILKFLERVSPKSPLLLEQCLHILSTPYSPQDWYHNENSLAAARIVANNFRGNEKVLKEVINNKSYDNLSAYIISAIFIGWSDSKQAKEILKFYRDTKKQVNLFTYFQIITVAMTTQKLFDEIIKLFRNLPDSHKNILSEIYSMILQRVEKDQKLQDLLVKHLLENKRVKATEKISIYKLLLSSGSSKKLKEWQNIEITKQTLSKKVIEIGYDISTGEVKSVLESILLAQK